MPGRFGAGLEVPRRAVSCAATLLLGSCSSSDSPTIAPPTAGTWFTNASGILPLNAVNGRDMDAHAVDIDGDGRIDLILAVEFLPNRVLLNQATGRFLNAADALPVAIHDSEDVAAADFDGDGDIDLFFVSEDDQINELYLNDGQGGFIDATANIPVTGISNAVLAEDLTGDGAPDLLIGNNGQNRFLVNDGTGLFTDETNLRLPIRNDITQDLELGDIDGDGDLDLVVGNEDENRVLINNGFGFFVDETAARLPLRAFEMTREADLGDVDGDGDLDLAFANVGPVGADRSNRLLINDGTGRFSDETALRVPNSPWSTFDVDFADFDGDGDLDIIWVNAFGGNYQILINDGMGRFEDQSAVFLPNEIIGDGIDAEAFDVNGDGVLDLYLTHYLGADFLLLGGGG